MANRHGIFCLEGLWHDDLRKRSTVRPILELLNLNSDIPYIHSDCATTGELEFYLNRWTESEYNRYPILYLAFHGKEHGIWISDEFYSLDQISELLEGMCRNRFIIFASCSTVNIDTRLLKKFIKNTEALAICGYKLIVPWIQSTAFELMLLEAMQNNSMDGRGIKAMKKKIVEIAGIVADLQFNIISQDDIISKDD